MKLCAKNFLPRASWLAWLALALCPITSQAAPAATAAPRPNVMVILVDDMGFSDAGCYGGEIGTPNLDRLAAGGLRFTQFYNTARCWPSRACILTGYYAQQVRRDDCPAAPAAPAASGPSGPGSLPELLRPLGYRSYHSGKWHVDGRPLAMRLRPLVRLQRQRPSFPWPRAAPGRPAAAARQAGREAITPARPSRTMRSASCGSMRRNTPAGPSFCTWPSPSRTFPSRRCRRTSTCIATATWRVGMCCGRSDGSG